MIFGFTEAQMGLPSSMPPRTRASTTPTPADSAACTTSAGMDASFSCLWPVFVRAGNALIQEPSASSLFLFRRVRNHLKSRRFTVKSGSVH